MFEIGTAPSGHPWPGKRMVLDRDRGYWLQYLGSHGPISAAVFLFGTPSGTLAFDAAHQTIAGRDVRTLFNFGTSPDGALKGVRPFRFEDSQQLQDLKIVAAEALIAFGRYYDGDAYPEGAVEVRLEEGGRGYTRASFADDGRV